MQSIVMLVSIMFSVIYVECYIQALYAESHYAEFRYVDCHFVECRGAENTA
jgi:hypothetical protein